MLPESLPSGAPHALTADALPCLLWLADAEARRVHFNKAWLDFRGRSADQEYGDGWIEGVHADDRRRWRDAFRAAAAARAPFEIKYRLRRADGAYRWVVEKAAPAVEGDTVRGFTGVALELPEAEPAPGEPHGPDQFRLMIEAVRDYAIFMLDPAGRVATWNAGAERIKGYRAEEIVGRHFSCLYTPDDLRANKPARALAAAAGEGRYEEEGWRVRKDDSPFWASVVITAVRDDAGGLLGYCKVTRDLSERKRAETELRASHAELERRVRERTAELVRVNEALAGSEERLRLMIEGVKDYAIFTLDLGGRVTSWNAGAARIYGYTPEEIVGQHRSRFFTAEEVARGLPEAELREAAATGRFSEESWRVRKDGTTFWANGTMTALRDPSGRVRGFVKVVRDLTEQKKAETEQRRILAALQLRDRAMQAVSQGILITDPHRPDNPIIYASQGFENLTGYRADEIVGRNCRFLHGPETDRTVVGQIREAVRAGREVVAEVLNYRKDGTTFWNGLTVTPVRDERDDLVHFVGVQTDVTPRRNLEEQVRQAQKMEAFGQLAGGVAHDFNNLLTIISGYGELLLGAMPPPDPNRGAVLAIADAGERAAGLTRQLLAFSRQAVHEPQVVDLNAVVGDTEKMLRRVIGEDIVLATALDPASGRVRVDPGQVGQVLLNLAVNARDAMPRGGRLTVETKNVELDAPYVNTHIEVGAGRYVLLAVSDTGTGMPPEVRARVFEPFFTTKGVGKGTGLGLSVVHGIVKQSNGYIGAYSELGIGTTFKIYLPAVEDRPAPAAPRSAAVRRGSETILLVEDEDAVRGIALVTLEANGYTVLSAANGRDAVGLAGAHPGAIDLLVTDVVMPQMSGREVADALRPRFPAMRVLYLSGYTDDAVVRHGILQAEVAFLQKPYTPTTLLKKIRQVLDEGK
jgi:PAS domain S-box-containing protein